MDNLLIALSCRSCKQHYTKSNFPLQSATCGHSICLTCLDTEAGAHAANNNKSKNTAAGRGSGSEKHEHFGCPICKENDAFHLHESKPNLLALSALQLLTRGNQIMKDKLQLQPRTSTSNTQNAKDDSSPAHPTKPTSKSNNKANTTPASATSISSPTTTTTTQQHHNAQKRKISLSPVSPARMVWVKFGQGSQLAYLLHKKGNKATIRWESSKYEEEISVDMIEELEDSGTSSRGGSKRSSRRARPMAQINITIQQQQQSSKKRRVIKH